MTSTDPGDVSTLKGRRKRAAAQRTATPATPAPNEDAPIPLPPTHDSMTAALRRPAGLPAFDPRLITTLAVAETGGHVPASRMDAYVVAAFDATEQVRPPRCRTPVTRVLWSKGQHVRRDVYQAFLDAHPEIDPATGIITITPTDALTEPEGEPNLVNPEGNPSTDPATPSEGEPNPANSESEPGTTGEPVHSANPTV